MKTLKRHAIAVMVLVTLSVIGIGLTATPASAQTSTFMYVEGIKGSANDVKHVGWINVASFGQSASNPPQSPSAGSSARVLTGACDLEVLKGLDAAGPHLWAALFRGDVIKDVRIEVWMTRPAGDQVQVYEVRLQSARIASITAASAVTFAETLKLSGEKIELTVYPFNANGTPSGAIRTGWDCRANARL